MREAAVDRLLAAAAGLRAPLSRDGAARITSYLEALLRKNDEVNLTAIRDLDDAILRHAADSLAFALHAAAEGVAPERVLDLGTGGGFPGVPIAVAWPKADVLLLDGTRKKADAVRELCAEAAVRNAEVLWARAEDVARQGASPWLGACDAVVARAVGPLAELVVRGGPFVRRGGHLVCWKSDALSDEERRLGLDAARAAGFESVADLPYVSDRPSRLVRYRRGR
ncbi:MAG TPA: 16S rRNA (guanine(527)-N(7))-methyltransferase RsmG [Planctomycetota bacterium]|nr:16S rRNA (guanine(527)-N(7))-methyltransferase RsmG [Planctomycetota bacterium]